MAVTINTIPSQNGTIVRALITAGEGGDNTSNRKWYSERGADDIGSVEGDVFVSVATGSIDRLMWHANGQLRFLFTTGGILTAVASGGDLFGKSILIAFDDEDPAIDVQLDISDATTISNTLRFAADADQEALYDAVAVDDLINVVICDTPSVVVNVDTAAAIAAGAPTVEAAAETVAAQVFVDTAAAITAGAPTVEAAAEKVDIQQPFHDVEAAVDAGAPSVTADAERVEGGIQETSDVDVTAGAAEVEAQAEKVEAAAHDTGQVSVDAGAPGVTAAAETVQPGTSDVDAAVDAGTAEVAARAERVEVPTHDVAVDVAAGSPAVEAGAERQEVGTQDVSADITAGAPDIEPTPVKTGLYVFRVTPLQSPFIIEGSHESGPEKSQGREEPNALGFNAEFWVLSPEKWTKGNAFDVSVARHLETNIDSLRLDYNLFIHGRRVARSLGAGDVVIWPYASGPGEWTLGLRRQKYVHPRAQISVRVGPDGEDYDRAQVLIWEIHRILSASWTGQIPRVV